MKKKCCKCNKEKDLEDFHKAESTSDGFRTDCKKCVSIKLARYYKKNKDKIKKYYHKNKQKILSRQLEYVNKRRVYDLNFKILKNLRARLWHALAGKRKTASTIELVGCSQDELISHLESQFTDGMSWDNYGVHGWHIDHIVPCASFDMSDENQQKQCFHYTNLQPLWAKDNLTKGNKTI